MSHTFASRCTVCGAVDDMPCPECRTSSAATHGTADQRPFTSGIVYSDGSRHEWHPQCLTPSAGGDVRCPDNGRCHHECRTGCFRVNYCGPLSGVYPGDRWPEYVRAEHSETDGVL